MIPQLTTLTFATLAACAFGCAATNGAATTTETAATETAANETIFHQIVDEGLNRHDTSLVDRYFSATMVDHDLPPGTPPGPAGSKMKLDAFLKAFPDIHFTFDSAIASGDFIAGRGYFTGTQTGPFQGIPATGKHVKVTFMDLWRFDHGKVAEYWGQPDVMGLMTQLGAIPGPQASNDAEPGHNEAGEAFMKAFRNNDVDTIVDLYTDDAIYFPTDRMEVKGRDQIRASFVGFFGAFTVKEAHTSNVQHRTLGDLSFSWGRWAGTLAPKAGGAPFKFEGRFTDVSKRTNGQWRYVVDHASFPSGK